MGLQNRFPTLSITLAFTCSEAYARFRLPAGHDFAYITQPYDERVYCFFTVSGLIGHVNRTAPNAKYNWLLSEWRQGRVARQALSLALQTGDRGQITAAQAAYSRLHFYPRNGLPRMPR